MKTSKAVKAHLKMSSDVMALAWKLSRKAEKKFGFKASDFFQECLKTAWKALTAKQLNLFA